MTANDKHVLVDGLKKLAEDAVSLAAFVKALFPPDEEHPDGSACATVPGGTPDSAADAVVSDRTPDSTTEAAEPAGRPAKAADAAPSAGTQDFAAEAPAKTYTYEEARAVLAEKSRTGHRAEVKAILTRHGVKQLSEVTDPVNLAVLVAEAEVIPDD